MPSVVHIVVGRVTLMAYMMNVGYRKQLIIPTIRGTLAILAVMHFSLFVEAPPFEGRRTHLYLQWFPNVNQLCTPVTMDILGPPASRTAHENAFVINSLL